jgi:hypothetical protein
VKKQRRTRKKINRDIIYIVYHIFTITSIYASAVYTPVMTDHPNDPLYGRTLESVLTFLVDEYGWEDQVLHHKTKHLFLAYIFA